MICPKCSKELDYVYGDYTVMRRQSLAIFTDDDGKEKGEWQELIEEDPNADDSYICPHCNADITDTITKLAQ